MEITDNRRVDIHTHILPQLDDGAQSVEESVRILLAEKRQGVTDVVFTPHFDLQDNIDDFLCKREKAFKALEQEIRENSAFDNMKFYKGAEVKYNPYIVHTELEKLCIEGTSYLLLEPLYSVPFNFEQTIYNLLANGVTPIIAHVERFDYLVNNIKLLQQMSFDGVIFQCNAGAISNKVYSKNFKKLLKHDLVHVLASDTHNLTSRQPNLGDGYAKLKKFRENFEFNAQRIIENQPI